MGPLSETTKFTSNPSVPTEDQHAAATLKIATFSTLSDMKELPCPKTNLWNRLTEKGNLGGYSNKAGVNQFVRLAIEDILEALGIRDKVTIRAEVEVMRNRPDFMLILVNGHPIGTIEGKQPGDVAMSHLNILGEVYDQLMHLHSIFRVKTPFAILTSFEQWRICWLDTAESNELARSQELHTPSPYETPVKPKKDVADKFSEMDLEDETSPQPPPTPSRGINVGQLQKVDVAGSIEEENVVDAKDREFCGTNVLYRDDKSLPLQLASVIKKMMIAKQDTKPAVLRYANATKSAWKRAPSFDELDFNLCISSRVKCFFLWEDLGHGADGRAFLVSGGTKGAVGVLKFFYTEPATKAQHEASTWKKVYGHLSPVATTVRTVQVMGQTALLMPWFQCPARSQSNLEAVKETLTDDFMGKGIRHDDVAWRNVGVYRQGGQTKAVVFDMQKVYCVEKHEKEDWVTPAVARLSKKVD
jgi:hypothetical protein